MIALANFLEVPGLGVINCISKNVPDEEKGDLIFIRMEQPLQ
jgi:hypothetical protein